jgi:hypothetical protein
MFSLERGAVQSFIGSRWNAAGVQRGDRRRFMCRNVTLETQPRSKWQTLERCFFVSVSAWTQG